MNISQLLEVLKNDQVGLSVGEKLIAGFSITILSMVVVFIILVLIAGIISLLQREKEIEKKELILERPPIDEKSLNTQNKDIGELVAVITAAICAATGNSSNDIIVRKIVRSNNSKSSWESMKKNRGI